MSGEVTETYQDYYISYLYIVYMRRIILNLALQQQKIGRNPESCASKSYFLVDGSHMTFGHGYLQQSCCKQLANR